MNTLINEQTFGLRWKEASWVLLSYLESNLFWLKPKNLICSLG